MTPHRVALVVVALAVLLTATVASAARVTVSSKNLTTFAGTGPVSTVASVARCAIAEDTYVDEKDKSTAHNGAALLVNSEQGNRNRHAFVRMVDPATCVPGIVALKIQSATLKLVINAAPTATRTYNVARVNNDWLEGTLTSDGTAGWSFSPLVATATVSSSSTGTISWDVTNEVKAITSGTVTSLGWRLADSAPNANPGVGSGFYSKDCTPSTTPACTAAQKPYVEVVFTP